MLAQGDSCSSGSADKQYQLQLLPLMMMMLVVTPPRLSESKVGSRAKLHGGLIFITGSLSPRLFTEHKALSVQRTQVLPGLLTRRGENNTLAPLGSGSACVY